MKSFLNKIIFKNKITTIFSFCFVLILGSYFIYNTLFVGIRNVFAVEKAPDDRCFILHFGPHSQDNNTGGTFFDIRICATGIFVVSDFEYSPAWGCPAGYDGNGDGNDDCQDPNNGNWNFKIDCATLRPTINTIIQQNPNWMSLRPSFVVTSTSGILALFNPDLGYYSVGKSSFTSNPSNISNSFKVDTLNNGNNRTLFYIDSLGFHYRRGMCNENTPITGFTDISVGADSACGIKGGKVYCWGYTSYGKSGISTSTLPSDSGDCASGCYKVQNASNDFPEAYSAYEIPGLTNVTQISVGKDHSCAISNGVVKCWGSNYDKQVSCSLGNIDTSIPQIVSGLGTSTPTLISSGNHSSSAIVGGTLRRWSSFYANSPVFDLCTSGIPNSIPVGSVTSISSSISAIAVDNFSCFVENGAVKCWSNHGNHGELWGLSFGGLNYSITPVSAPTSTPYYPLNSGVSKVAVGDDHACVLKSVSGTVYCWGYNQDGVIFPDQAYGTIFNQPQVVDLALGGNQTATDICAGYMHNCIRLNDGHVKCWGSEQLGRIGTTTYQSSIFTVPGISNAEKISCGSDFSCALINDGSVKCWGQSEHNLGYGINDRPEYGEPVYVTTPNFYTVDLSN